MRNNVVDPRSPLSRRGFLLAGVAGTLALTARNAFPATPGCSLISEQEEGPYYVEDETLRRNITEDKPGVPLVLAVMLVDAKTCRPLNNAALDIWHCDAAGIYSGFTAMSPDGGPGGPGGPRWPRTGRTSTRLWPRLRTGWTRWTWRSRRPRPPPNRRNAFPAGCPIVG